MNLTISLCEAAKRDETGTYSVLAFGITKLHVVSFPSSFQGTLLAIMGPVEPGLLPVAVDGQGPDGATWKSVGKGNLEVGEHSSQVISALPVRLEVPTKGVYTVRLSVGDQTATTQLAVVDAEAPRGIG